MPKDARLGLVVGVGLVIAFAVLSFRKGADAATRPGTCRRPPGRRAAARRRFGAARACRLRPLRVARTRWRRGKRCAVWRCAIMATPARSAFLFHANQDRLRAPDHVPIGTVLYIPELPADLVSGRRP